MLWRVGVVRARGKDLLGAVGRSQGESKYTFLFLPIRNKQQGLSFIIIRFKKQKMPWSVAY